jgi:hypothetical protein
MIRFRHILAVSLVAIAFLSVATPRLVCILGMWGSSSHSCCEPTTRFGNGVPDPGTTSCCVTAANNSSAVPAAAVRHLGLAMQVVAVCESPWEAATQRTMSASSDATSPPGCRTSSILRI